MWRIYRSRRVKAYREFWRGIRLEQVKEKREREKRRHYYRWNAVLELLGARGLDPKRTASASEMRDGAAAKETK